MAFSVPLTAGDVVAGTTNAGTSVTFTKPTNLADNDLLWFVINARSNTAEYTGLPTGVTALNPGGTRQTGSGWLGHYYKPITSAAGEPASYVFSGGASGRHSGVAFRITGATLTSLVDAVGTDALAVGGTPQTLPTPSVTATISNGLLITGESSQVGTSLPAADFTPPAGLTKIGIATTTTAAQNNTTGASFKVLSASGATGTLTFSATNTLQSGIGWAVVIKPAASSNVAPTANAGADQTVNPYAVVTLNGTGSSDTDGTIASYAWTQTGGTTVTLSSSSAASPTFTAPALAAGDTLTFSLVVTDNGGATSSADTVVITVRPHNEWLKTSGGLVPIRSS